VDTTPDIVTIPEIPDTYIINEGTINDTTFVGETLYASAFIGFSSTFRHI